MPTRARKPIVLTTRFEDGEDGTIRHVPFELPTGVSQFQLTVSYNDQIDSSDPERREHPGHRAVRPAGIEAGSAGFAAGAAATSSRS